MSIADKNLFVHIIDDDQSVRKALSRLLQSAGLKSCAYESAQSFLAQERGQENACILTDISMPTISGFDILDLLKQENSRLPVIVLSARDDDDTRNLVSKLGVQFFLRKPVDGQALIDAIYWVTRTNR